MLKTLILMIPEHERNALTECCECASHKREMQGKCNALTETCECASQLQELLFCFINYNVVDVIPLIIEFHVLPNVI